MLEPITSFGRKDIDHRLRADERGEQLSSKMNYLRQNPVAAGLYAKAEYWPWFIDSFAREH